MYAYNYEALFFTKNFKIQINFLNDVLSTTFIFNRNDNGILLNNNMGKKVKIKYNVENKRKFISLQNNL